MNTGLLFEPVINDQYWLFPSHSKLVNEKVGVSRKVCIFATVEAWSESKGMSRLVDSEKVRKPSDNGGGGQTASLVGILFRLSSGRVCAIRSSPPSVPLLDLETSTANSTSILMECVGGKMMRFNE